MPAWTIVIAISAVVFAIFLLIGMVYISWNSNYDSLPSVIRVVKCFPPFDSHKALLIVEDSHLLSNDMPISVYELVGDVEQIIGMGKVVHQQQTGEFQIAVFVSIGDPDWNAHITVGRGDALIVKPTIPASFMSAVITGGGS